MTGLGYAKPKIRKGLRVEVGTSRLKWIRNGGAGARATQRRERVVRRGVVERRARGGAGKEAGLITRQGGEPRRSPLPRVMDRRTTAVSVHKSVPPARRRIPPLESVLDASTVTPLTGSTSGPFLPCLVPASSPFSCLPEDRSSIEHDFSKCTAQRAAAFGPFFTTIRPVVLVLQQSPPLCFVVLVSATSLRSCVYGNICTPGM